MSPPPGAVPFDPARLPEDARAALETRDLVALERTLKPLIQGGESDPERIVAYAWAYLKSSEILLSWESAAFDEDCAAVLALLDAARGAPALSDPEGARRLFRDLTAALSIAPQSRRARGVRG